MISAFEFRDHLSRLIRSVVLFLVMLVFWGFVPNVPGGDTELFDGLRVVDTLKVILTVLMIGLTLAAIVPLGRILARYGVTAMGARPGSVRMKIVPSVGAVSSHVAQIIGLAVIWRSVEGGLPSLMALRTLRDFDWLPNAITLVFLGLAIVLLWLTYTAARPLFDELSNSLSERIAGASERKCPSCGASNQVGVAFCGACGTALPRQVAPPTLSILRCPQCGTENPVGAAFCGSCGTALPATTAPVTSPTARCPRCGTENPIGVAFCGSCGTSLVAAPPSPVAPTAPATPIAATGLHCPQCGTVNPLGSRFCGSCGGPLASAATNSPPDPATPA